MKLYEQSADRQIANQRIVLKTKQAIKDAMLVQEEDENSLLLNFPPYYLQVCFSYAHPLMIISLSRDVSISDRNAVMMKLNSINMASTLGCHAINEDLSCYSYRATQWLEVAMNHNRFIEMLGRCAMEANRAYSELTKEGF